mgnify:CR=1 FL=1
MPVGAPKGNQHAKGHGRKSAYQEKADADTLSKMYFKQHDQEEIEQDIRKGKFSIHERHILNAMEGDQKAITPIFQKLFPDTVKIEEETHLTIDV